MGSWTKDAVKNLTDDEIADALSPEQIRSLSAAFEEHKGCMG